MAKTRGQFESSDTNYFDTAGTINKDKNYINYIDKSQKVYFEDTLLYITETEESEITQVSFKKNSSYIISGLELAISGLYNIYLINLDDDNNITYSQFVQCIDQANQDDIYFTPYQTCEYILISMIRTQSQYKTTTVVGESMRIGDNILVTNAGEIYVTKPFVPKGTIIEKDEKITFPEVLYAATMIRTENNNDNLVFFVNGEPFVITNRDIIEFTSNDIKIQYLSVYNPSSNPAEEDCRDYFTIDYTYEEE